MLIRPTLFILSIAILFGCSDGRFMASDDQHGSPGSISQKFRFDDDGAFDVFGEDITGEGQFDWETHVEVDVGTSNDSADHEYADPYNDFSYEDDEGQEYSGDDASEGPRNHNSISPGDTCAPGCLWSASAVYYGAQSAQITCGSGECACVRNGDIYAACHANEVSDSSTPSSPSPNTMAPGDACGSGCIWSTYAVAAGAQFQEGTCGGQPCACVRTGDIYSSCSGHTASNPQPSPSPSPSASPSPPLSTALYGGAYDPATGGRIADAAYSIATRRNTTGYCYTAAADAIESVVSPFLYGASAYMAADQLASHPRFTEVSTYELRDLPAGTVVVWARGSSDHGHISIALGDGREASDHVAPQMTYHYGGGSARAFVPR